MEAGRVEPHLCSSLDEFCCDIMVPNFDTRHARKCSCVFHHEFSQINFKVGWDGQAHNYDIVPMYSVEWV